MATQCAISSLSMGNHLPVGSHHSKMLFVLFFIDIQQCCAFASLGPRESGESNAKKQTQQRTKHLVLKRDLGLSRLTER